MLDQSQYLKDRIDDQISWYEMKSSENKRWYIRLRILSIVITLSITLQTNFLGHGHDGWVKLAIALAAAVAAFLEGLMGLKKYHELWTGYRSTAEDLKYNRGIAK